MNQLNFVSVNIEMVNLKKIILTLKKNQLKHTVGLWICQQKITDFNSP